MKKISMLLMTILVIFFVSCKQQSKHAKDMNPFLMQYNTPFNVPPFDKIKNEHYFLLRGFLQTSKRAATTPN
jgi:peptidyl-dipeptidase Dcp